MDGVITSVIVFGCTFGGALLGMYLRTRFSEHQLGDQTAKVVQLATALTGTMAAMLLGLQLDSAKDYFNSLNDRVGQAAGNIILLDRTLAQYGPEAQPARKLLKANIERIVQRVWPSTSAPNFGPPTSDDGEALYNILQTLPATTETQMSMKSHAIDLAFATAQTRWLITAQQSSSVPVALIIVLVFWLTIIFISFGLFAPRNAIVTVSLCLCAASIAAAVFLLSELCTPFSGVIRVSSAPLRTAVAWLGR